MSVKIRCQQCHMFNSVKNTSCSKCGLTFKGKKSFYVEYRIDKKRKRDYAGTNITQAKDYETKIKYEIKAGIVGNNQDIMFGEYVEKIFIPHYGSKNKSLDTELYKFQMIIKYFQASKLRDITSMNIENYYQHRLSVNKPATAKNHLAIIRRMFNYAVEMGYLKESPVKTKSIKFDNKRTRFLLSDEKEKLLLECKSSRNPKLYHIVLIALETGMRRGEILKLKKDDIINGSIIVRAENSKTSTSRVIPLTNKLIELFKTFNDNDYNFNVEVRFAFENAIERAMIKDFHFHDLRHTFASDLVMKGVDLYTISKLLGHSTIDMTQRYAHLAPSALIEAIKKLN